MVFVEETLLIMGLTIRTNLNSDREQQVKYFHLAER